MNQRLIEINQGSRYTLNNGKEIPVIGYGVWRVTKEDTASLVFEALKAGYRLIDTAVVYGNQLEAAQGVHKFLKETGTPREQVFFTTKLWNTQQGYDETRTALKEISAEVEPYIGYVDLLLLHSPLTGRERRLGSWKALEEAVEAKAPLEIKSIGVSNFGIEHLKELLAAAKIIPVVDQLELHPWLPRVQLRKFLSEHNILAEAYSPLTQGFKFDDPELLELEKESGTSKTDILLKWSFLQGFIVIVKSSKPARIKQNIAVLGKSSGSCSLTDRQLDVLNKPNSYDVLTWKGSDPTVYKE